jgi:hypothetical protein
MDHGPPIDLLALFARFGREHKISLRDPQLAETFLTSVKQFVGAAVENDTLLYGQRTQNMFEALVISLGHYKLLKTEDVGIVHPEGQFTAPDFRIILHDDTQWLVEVKNVFDSDLARQRIRLRPDDVARLTSYAQVMAVPLKLAFYWARWGVWTLIDPADLKEVDGKLGIDMFQALRLSELARLGDRTIGTTPPLKLRLVADRSKPRAVSPSGEVEYYIGNVAAFCDDKEVVNILEQSIVWIFMQFGEWECSEPRAILSGDQLDAIEFTWAPCERANPGQRFEMIGTLSTMFSRYYAEQTLGQEGVTQTEAAMIPNWFAPLVDTNYKSSALPLWRFILQPSRTEAIMKNESGA